MPAIQPARLKLQAATLVEQFRQPAAFTRELHNLLGLYAERTHRPTESLLSRRLISSYQVPPPVSKQISNELRPQIASEPGVALALCDALWAEEWWEFRCLAAQILGWLDIHYANDVAQRLNDWLRPGLEQELLSFVLLSGGQTLRRQAPAVLLEQIKIWLEGKESLMRQAALRALSILIADTGQQNLPAAFKILTPHLRLIPVELRQDLVETLRVCARSSEVETAYLLQSILETSELPDTAWLTRQVIGEFSPQVRQKLQAGLRSAR